MKTVSLSLAHIFVWVHILSTGNKFKKKNVCDFAYFVAFKKDPPLKVNILSAQSNPNMGIQRSAMVKSLGGSTQKGYLKVLLRPDVNKDCKKL